VRYTERKAAIISPSPIGAHNWHPMAFSPRTGLVYLPVTETSAGFISLDPATFKLSSGGNIGVRSNSDEITRLFDEPGAPPRGTTKSYLQAWDPVAQREIWRAPNKVFGASGGLGDRGGHRLLGQPLRRVSPHTMRARASASGPRPHSLRSSRRRPPTRSTDSSMSRCFGRAGTSCGPAADERLSANILACSSSSSEAPGGFPRAP